MAETDTAQESFAYIPLSSLIIFLVILLTCASRRKKADPFNSAEQNVESDIKEEYAVMCFPCLKKKPELADFEPTADFNDQYEYIVEKYTIRKVPLLLANTAEDIIERQEELETRKNTEVQPTIVKDDFVNFQVSQEVYNVQKVPPCIAVPAHTTCPGRKERPRPSDILESMSPIPRTTLRNQNYVVIPTKGSLRNKDIMITKREITNQYLNNFSSVFVDNLKDQVPKDPERLPNLSRPYTSAFRNYIIPEQTQKSTGFSLKKTKRSKPHKIAYAFPAEEVQFDEEGPCSEEQTVNEKNPFIQEEPPLVEEQTVKEQQGYDSDSVADHTTYVPDSECQEEMSEKSFELLHETDSKKEGIECVSNPFKTTIKSSASEIDQRQISATEIDFNTSSFLSQKDDWTPAKNVTYEDIQALDVGYEFTSCEKLGVKPKKTRIRYPHESERLKESLKQLALGDTKNSKRCFTGQSEQSTSSRTLIKSKIFSRIPELGQSFYSNNFIAPSERTSVKSLVTETSFLPVKEHAKAFTEPPTSKSISQAQSSTTTFTSKSEDIISGNELEPIASENLNDSVAEISKMFDLSACATGPQRSVMGASSTPPQNSQTKASLVKFPSPSKSRSFDESPKSSSRKENALEAKGNDHVSNAISGKKIVSRVDESEMDTSYSLFSHESKTSTVVTSPRSSEPDDGKRATLRWKIVIKHHREENPSKKNVNVIEKH